MKYPVCTTQCLAEATFLYLEVSRCLVSIILRIWIWTSLSTNLALDLLQIHRLMGYLTSSGLVRFGIINFFCRNLLFLLYSTFVVFWKVNLKGSKWTICDLILGQSPEDIQQASKALGKYECKVWDDDQYIVKSKTRYAKVLATIRLCSEFLLSISNMELGLIKWYNLLVLIKNQLGKPSKFTQPNDNETF